MSKDKYIHERYNEIKESIGGNYGFFEIGFNFGLEYTDQETKLLTEQLEDVKRQNLELQEKLIKSNEALFLVNETVLKLQQQIDEKEKELSDVNGKLKSYKKLKDKIDKCYFNEDSTENKDSDLFTIGEVAAIHFGYL